MIWCFWKPICNPIQYYYSFCRYIQVGNAVAVPVGIALGYAFGQACQGLADDDQPLTTLPFKFPNCLAQSSSALAEEDSDWNCKENINLIHQIILLLVASYYQFDFWLAIDVRTSMFNALFVIEDVSRQELEYVASFS